MNRQQKLGIYVAAAISLVLLFLHSPWTGYNTDIHLQYTIIHVSLWDWRTSLPLVEWLGLLQNLVASLVFVFLLLCIWIFANRKANVKDGTGDA